MVWDLSTGTNSAKRLPYKRAPEPFYDDQSHNLHITNIIASLVEWKMEGLAVVAVTAAAAPPPPPPSPPAPPA
ncbi:hypothetical protein M0804_004578 [Polistes exclamans]|nr:hypothetical protein M0804_004578 [Polistes exclamans]